MKRRANTQLELDFLEDRPVAGGTGGGSDGNRDAETSGGGNRVEAELQRYLAARLDGQRQNEKRITKLTARPAKKGAPGRTRNLLPGALARVWEEKTR